MLTHINGHIMTNNENENLPILVFNPVNTSGIQTGIIGDHIKTNIGHANGLYKAKCHMIRNGHGGMGDIQNICLLANNGYILINAFCLYENADIAIDETALVKTLRNVRNSFPNDIVRIPYKLGHKEMTGKEWGVVFSIIMRELVNNGMNVEIWHNVN